MEIQEECLPTLQGKLNSPLEAEDCAHDPLVGKNKYRFQHQYPIFSLVSLEINKYNLLKDRDTVHFLSTAWLLQKPKAGKNLRLTYWYYLMAEVKTSAIWNWNVV